MPAASLSLIAQAGRRRSITRRPRVRRLLIAGVAAAAVILAAESLSGHKRPGLRFLHPASVSVEVSPAVVRAGAWTPLRFTFKAANRRVEDGTLVLTVPTAWPFPSMRSDSPGHVTASAGVLTVRGARVIVTGVKLAPGATLTVSYGGGSAGATEPEATGKYVFAASSAATSSGRLGALAPLPAVKVTSPAFGCRTTRDPSGIGGGLGLPNGLAQPNLHNTRASRGSVRQCYTASGLTTAIELAGVVPISAGPAGYPELAYGYHLLDQPFCPSCHAQPFPLPVSDLASPTRDYWLTVRYALGAPRPSSLPLDFIYDLWLERHPSPGTWPRPGDLELLIFLYDQQPSAVCLPSRPATTFSATALVAGHETRASWRVCQIQGGTEATPVAFFLQDPAPARTRAISLRLRDFIDEGSAFLGQDLRSHSVMGLELGGEVNQCSRFTGCIAPSANWHWRVGRLALEGASGTVPIVFSVRP